MPGVGTAAIVGRLAPRRRTVLASALTVLDEAGGEPVTDEFGERKRVPRAGATRPAVLAEGLRAVLTALEERSG
ncbi:hypothetical protein ACIBAI_07865 [Streptomyces sp. NPDC051041]|uniref:hypothetical protein n=1 Tax=Streptomyces sp. NPDC051041 TaxID=3365640 RepID=UPI00379ABFC9